MVGSEAKGLPVRREESHADAVSQNPVQWQKDQDDVFLGLECGGTRTVALAVDASGVLKARVESGPANLRLVSDEALVARFEELRGKIPTVRAIGAGIAGVRGAADVRRVEGLLERVWPGVPRAIDHDLQSALAAAEMEGTAGKGAKRSLVEARVIVLSGTGSCCFGRASRGTTAKVGGWGHLLGDRCSGYDIAHSALRHAVAELDRSGTWGVLGSRVLRRLQLNEPDDLIAWMQSAGKGDIAGLAPEVFAAAEAGDRGSRHVLEVLAGSLAEDAVACARRLVPGGGKVAFHLTGSVLLKQPKFGAAVARRIRAARPGSLVAPLQRESVWGAVAMAREVWLARNAPGSPVTPARKAANRTSIPTRASAPVLDSNTQSGPWIPASRGLSPTELRNPRSRGLDRMTLSKALDCFWSEERLGMEALNSVPVRRSVMALVRSVEAAFRNGGRLIYVGAGTSGRLGVLDASECPPTFRTPPEWVQGVMAGGVTALHSAVEGAEDDTAAGSRSVEGRKVCSFDVVVGIAASGRTPFVWGALDAARKVGAKTGLITLNPRLSFRGGWKPDHVIAVETGPEVITGSTRLKAGTATKLILNVITSLSMVRLGKVMDNLMVDLNPSNAKLRDRAARMVMELTGVGYAEAVEALMPGTKNGAGSAPVSALRTIREAVRSLRRRQEDR